jgi:phosphate starvation-inducible protein PhoH
LDDWHDATFMKARGARLKSPDRNASTARLETRRQPVLANTQASGEPPGAADGQSAELTLAFDDNRFASLLFGQYDQNIAKLERRLGIAAHAIGNHVTLKGSAEACDQARRVLEILYSHVKLGHAVSLGDVDGAIQESVLQGSLFPKEAEEIGRLVFDHVSTRKRGVVKARNAAQDLYLRALKRNELVFAEGPAGTGKTWLAVGHAVAMLEQGVVERLVLSRPAVEAGERLGFLPGDMRDKVDPYLRPIYADADEDVSDTTRRRVADDRERRSIANRPAGRAEGGPERSDPSAQGARRDRACDFPRYRCRPS